MTKRIFLIGLIILFVISFAIPAYCDDAIRKLGRGIANVATSPYEIIYQISKANNSDGMVGAASVGVLKGFAMIGVRALVGVYEIISFPFPLPKDYKPILKDPEFFFEDQIW